MAGSPNAGMAGSPDRVESGFEGRAVLEAWRSAFARTDIHDDSDFFELGGDLVVAADVTIALEQRFGIEVPIEMLLHDRTPRAIARRLATAMPSSSEHLLRLSSGRNDVPTVVHMCAWDNVFGYLKLQRAIDEAADGEVPQVACQYRDDRTGRRRVRHVEKLAELFLDDLTAAGIDGPLVTLGWSVGGLVAYEVARRAAAEGRDVRFVALVDTAFPRGKTMWEKRYGKYEGLLTDRSYRAAARSLMSSAGRRSRSLASGVARRTLGRTDSEPARPRVTTDGTWVSPHPPEAFEYRPPSSPLRIVMYAASESDRSLTVGAWRPIVERLDDVTIEGRHSGDDTSIMFGSGVRVIAADLADRLVTPPSDSR